MRTATQWFDEYSLTHQNSLNQKIHYVCVPAIFWSVAALLFVIPMPTFAPAWLNWTMIVLIPVLGFYASLGIKYFITMFDVSLVTLLSIYFLRSTGANVGLIALIVFVVAWIGQFYGHKVEGKKPSFFTDLVFLLIGPLWVTEKALRTLSSRN